VDAAVETAQDVTASDERRTPAHARPGLRHWAVVAAGCAAVVGGALAATSATGAVTPTRTETAAPASPGAAPIDPAKAELPLDCGPFPVAVTLKAAADLGTVVAAHCQAEMGTPPDAVYLLAAGADGRPKVTATLAEDSENLTFTELTVRSDGSVRGRAKGYSSDDVPRFAPDLTIEFTWSHQAGKWSRTETRTPAKQV